MAGWLARGGKAGVGYGGRLHDKDSGLPPEFKGKPLEGFSTEQHNLFFTFQSPLWPDVGERRLGEPRGQGPREEALEMRQLRGGTRAEGRRGQEAYNLGRTVSLTFCWV